VLKEICGEEALAFIEEVDPERDLLYWEDIRTLDRLGKVAIETLKFWLYLFKEYGIALVEIFSFNHTRDDRGLKKRYSPTDIEPGRITDVADGIENSNLAGGRLRDYAGRHLVFTPAINPFLIRIRLPGVLFGFKIAYLYYWESILHDEGYWLEHMCRQHQTIVDDFKNMLLAVADIFSGSGRGEVISIPEGLVDDLIFLFNARQMSSTKRKDCHGRDPHIGNAYGIQEESLCSLIMYITGTVNRLIKISCTSSPLVKISSSVSPVNKQKEGIFNSPVTLKAEIEAVLVARQS
jgi:hypothetical protein